MRVYGTILLLLLSVLVFIGVRVVNYFALFCLACVLVSMVSIYVGIIVHTFIPVLSVCTLGGAALEGKYCIYFIFSNELLRMMVYSKLLLRSIFKSLGWLYSLLSFLYLNINSLSSLEIELKSIPPSTIRGYTVYLFYTFQVATCVHLTLPLLSPFL